jgi:S-methylmethionine-dependent homocysteine/selenocysteine methylase
MDFRQAITHYPVILAEGAVIERLRRNPTLRLDRYVAHARLVYDRQGQAALRQIYRQYLDIGRLAGLPLLTCAPTWRANPARLKQAGFDEQADVNGDCVRFLTSIRAEYRAYAGQVFVGGLMSCQGDAYKPAEALPADEAATFHRFQARALAAAGVDFLLAATLPAASEALGLARAMAGCGLPYALSFVLRPSGTLLDGTPLHQAVATIDSAASPAPLFYMANCVHPAVFESAFAAAISQSPEVGRRVIGLQANTSTKSPEELDKRGFLDGAEPEPFANAMVGLHHWFGTKILGGCCGTDNRHIAAIARRLGQEGARP